MRVLITRPKADSERLARVLCDLGHHPVISPLMKICFLEESLLDLTDVQGILATSANGVRALARRTPRRNISIFAVGPQTAAEADSLGFENVRNAGGDSVALAEFVLANLNPASGVLLHVTGTHHNPTITAKLRSAGFRSQTATLYDSIEMPQCTNEARERLASNEVDTVMLFSPRSSALFVEAVGSAALGEAVTTLGAVCISRAAAMPLLQLPLRRVDVATSPNQDSMIEMLSEIG